MRVINRIRACAAVIAAAVLATAPAAAASGSGRVLTVKRARFRAGPRFAVRYQGSSRYHTRYHSRPPNPGASPDTNDANDASTQRWSITFRQPLVIPVCHRTADRSDPCARVKSLQGASGATSAAGLVVHTHVDGVSADFNRSISCRESIRTPSGEALSATLSTRYLAKRHAFEFTALDPVISTLAYLPGQCPGQGDSIDGLLDNYFTPGFSFSPHYGADRWFTSRTMVISTSVLRRAAAIKLRLGLTRHGTSPRNCAVAFPAYETCTTGGSWSGVLTIRRKG
jgi:hypothetical protein